MDAKRLRRVYHTAIAIVPPEEDPSVWDRLQEVRERQKDKGYYRWPPHVNLVYPFIDVHDMEKVVPVISNAVSTQSPFDATFSDFDVFGGKSSGICWLAPEPKRSFCNIYQTIISALASVEGEDESGSERSFQPHMTVSHLPSKAAAVSAAEEEKTSWDTLSFPVRELHILHRDGPGGQFSVMWRIPIGSGEAIFEGGKKYEHMPREEPDWTKNMRVKGGRKGGRHNSGSHNR